ncbi:MAG TPA: RDD family protein, partial [Acidimicrobiia bacterium]|nr:RDD family protein [Acidimicrobiia bacterium]
MTYDDRISIPTPEGVELELVLAGLGSRLVAAIVDQLIKLAVFLALFVLGGALSGDNAGGFLVAVLVVASFLVFFGYDVAFETLASGRTPGKRAAGLRVVRLGGEPVGFLASAVRNLLRLVDSLPGIYAVGAVCILFSSRNQRLGDLAAGTLVVRERTAAAKAAPSWTSPAHPPVADADIEGWDAT